MCCQVNYSKSKPVKLSECSKHSEVSSSVYSTEEIENDRSMSTII